MAQTTQIVPKFAFPHVETVINDYTFRSSEATVNNGEFDDTIRFIYPFTSSRGIDNVFVKKSSLDSFVATYGTSNFKKYGQPFLTPYTLLANGNCEVWCMRVMPDDATYANKAISACFKADSETDMVPGYVTAEELDEGALKVVAADATPGEGEIKISDVDYMFALDSYVKMGEVPATGVNGNFHVKLMAKTSESITTDNQMKAFLAAKDESATEPGDKDSEGYTHVPFMAMRSNGRGDYGNYYRVRITQNMTYEKEFGVKFYTFEILSTIDGSLLKTISYVGAMHTSTKYSNALLINDILTDAETGVAPVDIYVDENGVETVYDAYIEFLSKNSEALKTQRETMATNGAPAEVLAKIDAMLTDAANAVDIDEFDLVYGRLVNDSENTLPMFVTDTSDVNFNGVEGVILEKGNNGAFGEMKSYDNMVDAVTDCFKKAFDGTYDKRILSPRRIQASALFDANYPYEVKCVMADLTIIRNDHNFYMDTGIIDSFSSENLSSLLENYKIFDNYLISKNLHHYTIKEPTTNKRVNVTITYFLAQNFVNHMMTYGSHIPMVKRYCQLTGHVRDSLRPNIEEYDTTLKETLYENRFNYFDTVNDNVFQRGTQSTSQLLESDLTEESNVITLYSMKRIIEADIASNLYNFSDITVRNSFVSYYKSIFKDWEGRKIESFDIEFKMSEWEAERSIMHAYLSVVFRGIFKRAIIEIDINKRDYSEDAAGDNGDTDVYTTSV